MAEERITETTDAAGNVTERVIERGGEPTIINAAPASSGSGNGLIIMILLLALVVGGYFFLTRETQNRKDQAVAEAADDVGAAAKKVGDSVEKAVDKIDN